MVACLQTAILPIAIGMLNEGQQPTDAFSMQINYDFSSSGISASGQFNGNISSVEWRRGCDDPQAYAYTYDNLNRLSDATYYGDYNNSSYTATHHYDVPMIDYDFDGNILQLQRNADVSGTPTLVDDLNYTYGGLIKNRLTKVNDATNLGLGFNDMIAPDTDNYFYDYNGNLIEDRHKDIAVEHNYLDLPRKAVFLGAQEDVEFTYTAAGEKLTRNFTQGSTVTSNSEYCNGIEYNENGLEAIYTAEGRVLLTNTMIPTWEYQYYLTDQVGNVRSIVRPIRDGEPIATGETYKIVQAVDYYPFGLEFQKTSGENDYAFNSIEKDEELEVNMAMYRTYDPALGRWWQSDPIIKFYESPYVGIGNSPILYNDYWGLSPDSTASVDPVIIPGKNEQQQKSTAVKPVECQSCATPSPVKPESKSNNSNGNNSDEPPVNGLEFFSDATGNYYWNTSNQNYDHYYFDGNGQQQISTYVADEFKEPVPAGSGSYTVIFDLTGAKAPDQYTSEHTIWSVAGPLMAYLAEDNNPLVNISNPSKYPGVKIFSHPNMNGAITLGNMIFVGTSYFGTSLQNTLDHEYGHYLDFKFHFNYNQSLYLRQIGVPSFISATKSTLGSHSHSSSPTEKRANRLGGAWSNNLLLKKR